MHVDLNFIGRTGAGNQLFRRLRLAGQWALAFALAASLPACDGNKSYTGELWDENNGTYQAIQGLPFNREVADGTLPAYKFKNYMIQDYFYLQSYRRAYALLLPKAPDEQGRQFIRDEMAGIDQEIETVHAVYFKKYNITGQELSDSSPNPTTRAYGAYLTDTAAREPFQVGLIAMLPCSWIYYQVATDMKNSEQVEGNPYQEWIDAYGSTPWAESDAKQFVDLTESYLENADDQLRSQMAQAFQQAFDYEYMFWDTVYQE